MRRWNCEFRKGSRWNRNLRGGFTLVEVTVTVVVLVLVAGTVSLSLRGNLQAGRSELAVEQLRLVDQQTRVLAKRTGRRVELEFDVAARRVVRVTANRERAVVESDVPLRDVLSTGQKRAARENLVTVEFRTNGSSSSYAVGFPIGQEQVEWLVFAGGSGQCLRTRDQREVERLLE